MLYTISDMQVMAASIAESKLFRAGKERRPLSPDQALTLMLISAAEGKHPALGLKDYDIIDGRPAKKTECMLRDLLLAGGAVEWHALTDILASATFSHPQGGKVRVDWDIERVKKAGLLGKDVWQKYKRQMLRSRCVSEGVRTVYPAATSAMYCTEEAQDMAPDQGVAAIVFPSQPPADDAAESIDAACNRLAADVAASTDLQDTYQAHITTFERLAQEKPEWLPLMYDLLNKRQEELKNTPKQG